MCAFSMRLRDNTLENYIVASLASPCSIFCLSFCMCLSHFVQGNVESDLLLMTRNILTVHKKYNVRLKNHLSHVQYLCWATEEEAT